VKSNPICKDLKDLPAQECFYEDMVDFDMELAVIVARNSSEQ
jgi:5-(carboxyamino)imidazole ribonucleotide synthase